MSRSPNTVCNAVEFVLVVPDGPDRCVQADLGYSPADPYAIRVGFHTGGQEDDDIVEWTFARSLLEEGISRPVGRGDVQVWPSRPANPARIGLALSSPSGRAVFEIHERLISEFLAETYDVVPAGGETEFVDLDSELADLMDR